MKDYKTYVDHGEEIAKKIIAFGYDCEHIEGALVDSYFFETDRGVKIGRAKPRKYIMILEHFLNTWNSNHELIETDNDKKYYEMLEKYQKN